MKTIQSKRNGYVKRGIGWQADPFFHCRLHSAAFYSNYSTPQMSLLSADLPEIMRSLQSEAVWLWSASLST